MSRTNARSPRAAQARDLVEALQHRFRDRLEGFSTEKNESLRFQPVEWLRDDGRHGGGERLEATPSNLIQRGSINVSQVHYDDDPSKKLGSATALSTIVHPLNPRAPSVHIHISWTELRDGSGYWRVMADLNPAIEDITDTELFEEALQEAAPTLYASASETGDRYFYIPALERHRGATHFYLEGYRSDDAAADSALAQRVGEAAIDGYARILEGANQRPFGPEDQALQLSYHTLYCFQVLTLDRGTSSGLLVHDQNDVGILGSLPGYIDTELFQSFGPASAKPLQGLVSNLAHSLPAETTVELTPALKVELARVVRNYFRSHPEALQHQAAGDILPPTLDNHR